MAAVASVFSKTTDLKKEIFFSITLGLADVVERFQAFIPQDIHKTAADTAFTGLANKYIKKVDLTNITSVDGFFQSLGIIELENLVREALTGTLKNPNKTTDLDVFMHFKFLPKKS